MQERMELDMVLVAILPPRPMAEDHLVPLEERGESVSQPRCVAPVALTHLTRSESQTRSLQPGGGPVGVAEGAGLGAPETAHRSQRMLGQCPATSIPERGRGEEIEKTDHHRRHLVEHRAEPENLVVWMGDHQQRTAHVGDGRW